MDYSKIVIDGIIDKNSRKHYEGYIIRKFKEAEKEHYEPAEFFNGCLGEIEKWEEYVKNLIAERRKELHQLILITKRSNDSEEQKAKDISFYKSELENERANGIGGLTFLIQLNHITNGRFSLNLSYESAMFYKSCITKAYRRTLPQQSENSKTDKLDNIEYLETFSKCHVFKNDVLSEIQNFYNETINEWFDLVSLKDFMLVFTSHEPNTKLNWILGTEADFGYFLMQLENSINKKELNSFNQWVSNRFNFNGTEFDTKRTTAIKAKGKGKDRAVKHKKNIETIMDALNTPKSAPTNTHKTRLNY